MRLRFSVNWLALLLVAMLWAPGTAAQKLEVVLQPSDILHRAGSALVRGNTEEAAELYSQALKYGVSDRELYKALNNLCAAQYLLEQFDAAAESCRAAIAHRSNRWMAYNNLGLVLFRLGRYEEAIRAFEQGLELAPRSDRLKKNLALTERAYRSGKPGRGAPAPDRARSRGVI
ncbi:MAG: tetratricopeptide repeat protein [Alphaproteobacteria bacterium]|nr:MAG: tetratricopeptide repeat protein [Alphaproteobacteria bacterium]